jgi:hypothetical protein
MTPNEFKEKYPTWSHLEGNELWDKMEDVMLLEQIAASPAPPIVDWKGNVIEAEMSVVFISTFIQEQEYRMMYLDMAAIDATPPDVPVLKIPAERVWKASTPVVLQSSPNGSLYYNLVTDTYTCKVPLSFAMFFKQDSEHLAIVGVSDGMPENYKLGPIIDEK